MFLDLSISEAKVSGVRVQELLVEGGGFEEEDRFLVVVVINGGVVERGVEDIVSVTECDEFLAPLLN